MDFKTIVITGGAGFVGANLSVLLRARFPEVAVVALDNLKRRGSELNLSRLRQHGVQFQHGDTRCREDLDQLPEFELLIDCAAEPSVHAGARGTPSYVINTNLVGTANCLAACQRQRAAMLFLSTSRVYPIARLNDLPYAETERRFQWEAAATLEGFSELGIAEDFPLNGPRSFYGASKLASELLIQEYVHAYGLRAIINRCGLLSGPWQMGKVDQGVMCLWVAKHHYQQPLQYIGFGGRGKQVRDVLHVADLFELIVQQIESLELWDGRVYNVGGGVANSVSLLELTQLCQQTTEHQVPINNVPTTNDTDVRIFLSDCERAKRDFRWQPRRSAADIVADIHYWIREHDRELEHLLA